MFQNFWDQKEIYNDMEEDFQLSHQYDPSTFELNQTTGEFI